jgi:hypothetical protein
LETQALERQMKASIEGRMSNATQAGKRYFCEERIVARGDTVFNGCNVLRQSFGIH